MSVDANLDAALGLNSLDPYLAQLIGNPMVSTPGRQPGSSAAGSSAGSGGYSGYAPSPLASSMPSGGSPSPLFSAPQQASPTPSGVRDLSTIAGLAGIANKTGAFGNSPLSNGISDLNSALSIYNGIRKGGVLGDTSAALNAANLANKAGLFGSSSPALKGGLGAAGNVLGLVQGIQQGGVAGDTNAALAATQLAAQSGLFGGASAGVGAAAGAAGIALAPVIMGMSTPAVSLNRSYWDGLKSDLLKGKNDPRYWPAAAELESQMTQGGSGIDAAGTAIPADVRELASQLGLKPLHSYANTDAILQAGNHLPGAENRGSSTMKFNGGGSVLDHIRPSFADAQRFDDGGGVTSYFGDTPSYDSSNLPMVTVTAPPDSTGTTSFYGNSPAFDAATTVYQSPLAAGSDTSSNGGFLSGLLGHIPGIGSSLAHLSSGQQIGLLGGLANLLGSIGGGNNTGGVNMSTNYHPSPPPMFQGSGPPANGTAGPYGTFNTTPRQRLTPNVDYAHYGEGPAQQFFSPLAGHAAGGSMHGQESPLAAGVPHVGHVQGPGDGREDLIPARLSQGEWVADAETVSLLGNGSNEAGAKRLEEMRQNLRKHKGQTLAKGKFSPNAKKPEAYMRKTS